MLLHSLGPAQLSVLVPRKLELEAAGPQRLAEQHAVVIRPEKFDSTKISQRLF